MIPPADPPTQPVKQTLRVLLVDDAASVRQELRHLLELTGEMQVAGEAGDGQEAVRQALALAPDAVLMDLEMPRMDGFEATRKIKLQNPAPWVVILSVHAGSTEVEQAQEAGADRFVVKGSDYQTLVNAILRRDGPFNSSEKGE